MIEFNGEFSENCKEYILHYNKKFSLLVLTIASMIASIPIILFSVMWDGLCALFLLIFAVMLLYGLCYRTPKKDYSKYMPNTVVIDNGEIYSESAEFYYSRNLADIKFVIDTVRGIEYFFICLLGVINLYAKKHLSRRVRLKNSKVFLLEKSKGNIGNLLQYKYKRDIIKIW